MTPSTSPLTLSGMRAANQPLEARVADYLARVIPDAPAHARFMNMLSMLEHIGSRKIMLSQMRRDLPEETLKHLAEEARHAYFFKRQAERVAGGALEGYTAGNVTAYAAARRYFGRLDAAVAQAVGDDAAYPWVSLIVELRACWFYGLYQTALQKAGAQLSLKSLIAEEDRHLEEMYAACGSDATRLRKLSATETALFRNLWAKIEGVGEIRKAA